MCLSGFFFCFFFFTFVDLKLYQHLFFHLKIKMYLPNSPFNIKSHYYNHKISSFYTIFTEDILSFTCHNRKWTGVNNTISNGSVPFTCSCFMVLVLCYVGSLLWPMLCEKHWKVSKGKEIRLKYYFGKSEPNKAIFWLCTKYQSI